MAQSHVVFDGYSYQPPSYEEAQANVPVNQSVYNPTVSQDTNVVGGFRPLYTPSGYNGLSEYNRAKRRRKMRIAAATSLGIFCFILFTVIIFWKINIYRRVQASQSYKDSNYNNNDDLASYPSYKDSSRFNNNDYYRGPTIDDKPIQHSNNDVLDKAKANENMNNNDDFPNDGHRYSWETDAQRIFEQLKKDDFGENSANSGEDKSTFTNTDSDKLFGDIDAFLKKQLDKLNSKPIASSARNPTSTTEKAHMDASSSGTLSDDAKIKDLVNPDTGEIDLEKFHHFLFDSLKRVNVEDTDEK